MATSTIDTTPVSTLATEDKRVVACFTAAKKVADTLDKADLSGVDLGKKVSAIRKGGLIGKDQRFGSVELLAEWLTTEVGIVRDAEDKESGVIRKPRTFSRTYVTTCEQAAQAVSLGVSPEKANQITTVGSSAIISEALADEKATPETVVAAVEKAREAKKVAAAKREADKKSAPAKVTAPAKAKRATPAQAVKEYKAATLAMQAKVDKVSDVEALTLLLADLDVLRTGIRERIATVKADANKKKSA